MDQQPQGLALISAHNDLCSVSRQSQTHEQKLYGRRGSHGSGLKPFLLGALHAKIPGKELSKGGEGGGTNTQFREGRNKGEEKGDQKNGRARDLLIKQHQEVPESWPRRRREGE